jgi:uncharacterized protein
MNPLLLCCAAQVLLFAALSFNVSRIRLKRRKFPEITEAEVTKAVRAYGNAAEYIPLFVALFLYVNAIEASPSAYWIVIAVVATVSRFAHAAGMFLIPSVNHRHLMRFYGALGTYVCLFVSGGALLARAL